jgi:FMN-dependent NADH-azoreductase
VDEQLNGGEFAEITEADWNLIEPYLKANENLFGITIDRLLNVDGSKKIPQAVYRKIRPQKASTVKKEDDDGLEE